MKKFTIRLAPTTIKADFIFGNDSEKIYNHIEGSYNGFSDHIDDALNNNRGFTEHLVEKKSNKEQRILVYVNNSEDLITISHEIIHVTWIIRDICGFKYTNDTGEFQAYLHDYIFEKVLEKICG
jgi:hypothetical protein